MDQIANLTGLKCMLTHPKKPTQADVEKYTSCYRATICVLASRCSSSLMEIWLLKTDPGRMMRPPMWPQLPLIGIAWGTWFQDFDLASELPQILMQFTTHPLWRLGLRPRPPDPKRSQHFPLACKTNNHINHADGYRVTVKQFMRNVLCMALIKYEKTNIHKSAVNFSEGKM